MILFTFPGYEALAQSIKEYSSIEIGNATIRHFPDDESFVQILTDVKDKDVVLLCGLDHPDRKAMAVMFFTNICRELGAKRIGLVAPYLGYMRQDKRFHDGEAITSRIFANFLSGQIDWLVTIDPHLHRYKSLNEIYSIPATTLHAMDIIAQWIKENVDNPVLIGPDEESEQWASDIAEKINIPYIVLNKQRYGDEDVEVSIPDVENYKTHTPVLIDDIISTAHTMIETVEHLNNARMKPAICIGVHAIFAGNSYKKLLNTGIKKIVTCNTIQHETNAIDIAPLLERALIEVPPL